MHCSSHSLWVVRWEDNDRSWPEEGTVSREMATSHCSPVPELALEGVDLAVHGISWLGGVLQLPLELSAVGVGPLGLLFSLLQLPLQLLDARVRLVHLENCFFKTKQKKSYLMWRLQYVVKWSRQTAKKPLPTWSLYCSVLRRSSSTCRMTSFSFFSVRLTSLVALCRSLRCKHNTVIWILNYSVNVLFKLVLQRLFKVHCDFFTCESRTPSSHRKLLHSISRAEAERSLRRSRSRPLKSQWQFTPEAKRQQ